MCASRRMLSISDRDSSKSQLKLSMKLTGQKSENRRASRGPLEFLKVPKICNNDRACASMIVISKPVAFIASSMHTFSAFGTSSPTDFPSKTKISIVISYCYQNPRHISGTELLFIS